MKRKELYMYICPTCGRRFEKEEKLSRHFLACWREQNPSHVSKDAPRSPDQETRQVNNDVVSFFEQLKGN